MKFKSGNIKSLYTITITLSAFIILQVTIERAFAQSNIEQQKDIIYIHPLFEYPVAPEELVTLTEKSNWIMQHFWDSFDFSNKETVDQNALNDAFNIYAGPMLWADKKDVIKSTDDIIQKISGNPALLLQFTKAAEEILYGPRAVGMIDEVYVRYLRAITKNKKIPESRRLRYNRQLSQLENSMVEVIPPQFEFQNIYGKTEVFRPGLLTLIEFGDPDCDDCRYAKLKMETDVDFVSLVDRGLVNVLFIIPDADEGWEKKLASYPDQWHKGASDSVADIYDIRRTPFFYVIGTDGKIISKTGDVTHAMNTASAAVEHSK